MDIEEVAGKHHLIYKEEIHPIGIQAYQARRVAFNLGLSGQAYSAMVKFIMALFKAFVTSDASMVEINPVIKTSDDKILPLMLR